MVTGRVVSCGLVLGLARNSARPYAWPAAAGMGCSLAKPERFVYPHPSGWVSERLSCSVVRNSCAKASGVVSGPGE